MELHSEHLNPSTIVCFKTSAGGEKDTVRDLAKRGKHECLLHRLPFTLTVPVKLKRCLLVCELTLHNLPRHKIALKANNNINFFDLGHKIATTRANAKCERKRKEKT